MSARYAPLPNAHTDPDAINEMEAAFDDSDDEDDHHHQPRQPVNSRNGYQALSNAEPEPESPTDDDHHPFTRHHRGQSTSASGGTQGGYDFENVDFDWIRPPPGSPPGPSARAIPNEHGNSNGLIPSFSQIRTDASASARRGAGWFRRTAQVVLPSHYVQRLGWAEPERPQGPIGGGTVNDGVFANVTAKPSRGVRIQDGDEVYIVPEEVQKEVPPSYAQAQADAVPPYWETTIHAPSAASNTPGEVVIDGLPTGSLFSFLWNLLVSISFQFVGFLLTYLLHTTHAAKLGSRAGLGVTLIQYGFALRGKDVTYGGSEQDVWGGWKPEEPRPTFGTAAEAEAYYNNLNLTATSPSPTIDTPPEAFMSSDATTEWLSFLLMTIGWFILLTSVLGFWRVKRWERGILASQGETAAPATPEEHARSAAIIHSIERAFGLQGLANGSLLRAGLGFPGAEHREAHGGGGEGSDDEDERPARNAYVLPLDPSDPERNERIARAYADEARLHQDLRSAGLL
ncbi:hypothetical protein PYCCODRAFT_1433689 [Trametes coccinea BRFM310]|uniref:Metal homeostatis protein bsd2 n=1 Tax=Trametes coccinea (strain BRFM310) TaxID=1353009 RepID=A0A1Y2IVS4_TRAC3|nr:hypothetical protein PYCCODRAFT_1433689 [Trametes coccinea BRFM310]